MNMDRRQFITTAIAGAGSAILARPALAAAVDPFATVTLGKSGLKVTRIGIGTGMSGGNRQSNHTRMGQEKFTALIKHAWDSGIRFYDVADLYGTHPFLAKALKGTPRDQYVICSKIWTRPGGIPEKERPAADVVIDRFRKELDTDYIDLVLIHCMTDKAWTDQEKKNMDIMANLKAKGVIKAHGVSIHSLEALELAAVDPWVESVHTRINPYGKYMDDKDPAKVAAVLKKMHDNGKGVVGMKIVSQGDAKEGAQRDESIRYVLGLGCVDAMIVGFEKPEQIDDFSKRVAAVLAGGAAVA